MKPEKVCPNCGSNKIDWKVIRNSFGAPVSNGLCINCNAIMRGREPPEITCGKALERSGRIDGIFVKDISCMDTRIVSLPGDVQLGILRQRQK